MIVLVNLFFLVLKNPKNDKRGVNPAYEAIQQLKRLALSKTAETRIIPFPSN
jgi:hypothetical protein